METQNFDPKEVLISFDFDNSARNNGMEGRTKPPVGDYSCVVEEVIAQPAKSGEHVMLVVTSRIIAALTEGCEAGVNLTTKVYYAGSKESPKFMHERLACFCDAIKVKGGAKGLSRSQFIGKKYDATITWELSKASIDAATGLPGKQYVNERLGAERVLGTARPANIDPFRMSAAAIAVETGEPAPSTSNGNGGGKPWEAKATTVAKKPAVSAPKFNEPSDEEKASVMQYRAYVQLETDEADDARAALVEGGFDPNGEVDADIIEALDATVAQLWREKHGAGEKKKGGLAPLGARKTGTRAKA